MLQFITNEHSRHTVVDQVKAVIAGGCRWVQIRMKEASDEEIKNVVEQIKPLCIETETFLLLNDRVELAKELNVGGVHLGQGDMTPSKARLILGPAAVIGVTANTFDQIKQVSALDIDYIGVGPYAFTETKKNLAPVLGLEGISAIKKEMMAEKIEIPIVAVGGIENKDIRPLLEAGVNGVAVSSAIADADDMVVATKLMVGISK